MLCLCESESHSVMSLYDPLDIQSMEFSRPAYWSRQPFPSPRDLPNQGSRPGLPYCRQILYQLSHQRSPRILEWVTSPPPPADLPNPKTLNIRVSSGNRILKDLFFFFHNFCYATITVIDILGMIILIGLLSFLKSKDTQK